jgi:hypothetical protein
VCVCVCVFVCLCVCVFACACQSHWPVCLCTGSKKMVKDLCLIFQFYLQESYVQVCVCVYAIPGNTNRGVNFRTVDLLIKVACFVITVQNIINIKCS